MKKFYIPTTTLNFNNILSSESVSPKSFYEKRGFGYSRWFSIPENGIENIILLYESLCSFTRPKSDYEDHPLLIEVSLNEEISSKFRQLSDDVHCCDHTIYLTPWTTKFIFFSDKDKRVTLSMSDSSLETKLIKLYSKRLSVEFPKKDYKIVNIPDSIETNLSEIEKDVCINKMKGFLYGYYIGALLSTSKESVKRLNLLREVFNIFAAILSSLDKRPTEIQLNKLDLLLKDLRESDLFYKKLYNIIRDTDKTYEVLSLIKSEYGFLKNEINKELLLFNLYFSKEQQDSKNASIKWIENMITHQEVLIKNERQPLSTNKSEIVVFENKLSIISDDVIKDKTENLLFKAWINDLLSSKEYNGKVSSFKEKFSDDVTIKAKEIYQDKWADSYAKEFLNKLRRHVRGEEFGQQWNNDIFSSTAAVITNGGEWAKLLIFMQSNEMNNYRLAFAMFGALNGFANLTRDFTDIIYSCENKYIADVYKEFYGQLFNTDIITEYVEPKNEDSFNKNKSTTTLFVEKTDDTQSYEVTSFIDSLVAKCKGAEKDKPIYKRHYIQYGLSINLLQAIKADKTLNKGKGAQKAILNWLENSLKPSESKKIQKKHQSSQAEQSLFPSETKKEFYSDSNAFDLLVDLLPNDLTIKELFQKDLRWFQDEYAKGDYSKYYAKASKVNNRVISAFINYLSKKEYANKLRINKIIERLQKIYI